MKIASFSIQNYRCIKDLNVNCLNVEGKVRQWTVLLGENNSGKTNVLRALALLEQWNMGFQLKLKRREREKPKYFMHHWP